MGFRECRSNKESNSPSGLERREKDGEVTASIALLTQLETFGKHVPGEGDNVGRRRLVVVGSHLESYYLSLRRIEKEGETNEMSLGVATN